MHQFSHLHGSCECRRYGSFHQNHQQRDICQSYANFVWNSLLIVNAYFTGLKVVLELHVVWLALKRYDITVICAEMNVHIIEVEIITQR
jgi:hypothetical protein